jgi:hypothetical protein
LAENIFRVGASIRSVLILCALPRAYSSFFNMMKEEKAHKVQASSIACKEKSESAIRHAALDNSTLPRLRSWEYAKLDLQADAQASFALSEAEHTRSLLDIDLKG